ncbi:MAG: DUF4412 domain-containing protein, partial [Verrucomicrobiota bacterium]
PASGTAWIRLKTAVPEAGAPLPVFPPPTDLQKIEMRLLTENFGMGVCFPASFCHDARNYMKFNLRLPVFVAVLLMASTILLRAQMPTMGSGPVNLAMLKLFGANSNFTATAEVRVLDKTQKELMSLAFPMSVSNGKMRADMDFTKSKSALLTPEMMMKMKQMGADRTIYILRPDLKKTYMIYPGLNAYLDSPLDAKNSAPIKDAALAKTAIGKETIEGHPCVKNKVVITDDKGQKQEAIVWNATDLKDFPVQMQMTENDSTAIIRYKNVQFAKPDAKQFEPPAGLSHFTTAQQLQQIMMQKMMGAAPKAPTAPVNK